MSEQSQPIFFSAVREMPLASPGTISIEMPPGPLSFGLVRTAVVNQSARMPEVIKTFSPSTTYSSPSSRALVRSDITSVPPPGSVIASADIFSPRRMAGTTSCCKAALPWRSSGGRPMLWLNRLAIRPPLPPKRASATVIALRRTHGLGVPPRASG